MALQVDDLTEVPDGLRVLIRHSKTDQEGQGQEVAMSITASRLPQVDPEQAHAAADRLWQDLVRR